MQELPVSKYAKQWLAHPIVADADARTVERLLSSEPACIRVLAYDAGEAIYTRKHFQHELGFVLRGRVTVDRQTEHGGMRMSELGEGDLFGAAALYCQQQEFVVEIRARTDCRVLFVTEDAWTELLLSDGATLRQYLGYLGERLRYLNKRLDALSSDTMEDRLFLYLQGKAVDGVYTVKHYTHLADELCVGRATLYRAMDALCGQGRVLKDGNTIFILE